MEKVQIKAKERTLKTKSETKTLRKDGMIPGVYYSKHDTPISIGISQNALNPLVFTKETHLISLQLEDDRQFDCIIKDVQFDPVSDKVVHFDLLGLTSGETFQLEVPIKYLGSPIGIKEGGVLQQFLHKLDVECLPKDIPQHLEINIQGLNIGDSIHVSDLNFEGLTLLNPEETVIVSVTHAKVEVEPVAEEAVEGEEESAEPEVIGKGKADKEEEEEE
ncbi:MAG TPA: 50S ribosomal protein L25 [Ignavibacteriaceae bacterium]|nr:50S ribosomal protein L25 [Ignavibacteriaceae bacterium]